jgi:hypothetical protein
MSIWSLFLLSIIVIGCSSAPRTEPPATPAARTTQVEEKRREVVSAPKPVKGKFLDYILRIQPDHAQPGYSISTDQLRDGYAFGSGPYDGIFLEFFLFRGETGDLVFRQTTGYGVAAGASIEAYRFRGKKMRPVPLSELWPLKRIESIYSEHARTSSSSHWANHRLVKLPVKGTTIELMVCEKAPEPPFATETLCLTLAELRWNRRTFELRRQSEPRTSQQSI